MGKCPYCSGEVNEDLIVFGGPCPHCFNEIPGEEAATDPGAALRAKEAKADAAKAKQKQLITAAVVLLMLIAAGSGYGYYAKKKAEAEAILYVEFDADFDIFTVDPGEWEEIYGEEAPPEAVASTGNPAGNPTKATGGGTKPKQASIGGGSDDEELLEGPDFGSITSQGEEALAGAKTTGGATTTGGASSGGLKGGLTGGIGVNLNRDITLKTDAEIFRHIGLVMKRNSGQIKACYESTLKRQPDFAGTFSLTFTVNKDGSTKGAAVTGAGLDPEFERCMVSKVNSWKFYKLSKEAPVKYPLKLSPDM